MLRNATTGWALQKVESFWTWNCNYQSERNKTRVCVCKGWNGEKNSISSAFSKCHDAAESRKLKCNWFRSLSLTRKDYADDYGFKGLSLSLTLRRITEIGVIHVPLSLKISHSTQPYETESLQCCERLVVTLWGELRLISSSSYCYYFDFNPIFVLFVTLLTLNLTKSRTWVSEYICLLCVPAY
jgi:hypothetical protein